jgi:hypothetical protein
MKLLATLALFLLCSIAAEAFQAAVELTPVQPSFQNPRIAVLSGGKLQPGASLEVVDFEWQKKLSLKTDSQGVVALPDLSPGRYCLTASTSPNLVGTICLQISDAHKPHPDTFSIEIPLPTPLPAPSEDEFAAAEKGPVDLVTRSLSGTVVDPIGAVIPGASLAIYRQASKDRDHPLKATVDGVGHFSAQLEPGKYTVVVQSRGFKSRLITIEVSRDAPEKALTVKLDIGEIPKPVYVAGATPSH